LYASDHLSEIIPLLLSSKMNSLGFTSVSTSWL